MESIFQTIPVNIAGPSYQDRSRPLSSQETRGFYPELVDSGKEQYVIKSFPGQKNVSAAPAGVDRGSHQMLEIAYRVIDNVLYEVSKTGVHTNRGLAPGSDRCIFADDGVTMTFTADGNVSHYNSISRVISPSVDDDIKGALSVAFINNQFAYTFPLLTVFSAVGDATTATSLNAVGAESDPDDLVRDYVFDQILYRFGTRSCENWYNSGVGTPPFDRIEGQTFNVGLAATHSIAHTKDFIYWVGTDGQIHAARGGQRKTVSTAAISGAIQKYGNISDAFAYAFTLDNKEMYVVTFPAANKTWCLIEELGSNGWFELSEGVTDGRWNVNSLLEVYNRIYVGDRLSGEWNRIDFDTFDEAGNTWRRRRVLGSINGDKLNQKGHRVQMSRMEFIMDKGVGLISGQGADPKIMIEASYDGGKSWATGTWMRIGRLGETNIRAEWYSMKSFYDMIVRITTSDPVEYNIYSATIDLRLAGK